MLTSDKMANVSSECMSLACVRIYKVGAKGLNLLCPNECQQRTPFSWEPVCTKNVRVDLPWQKSRLGVPCTLTPPGF